MCWSPGTVPPIQAAAPLTSTAAVAAALADCSSASRAASASRFAACAAALACAAHGGGVSTAAGGGAAPHMVPAYLAFGLVELFLLPQPLLEALRGLHLALRLAPLPRALLLPRRAAHRATLLLFVRQPCVEGLHGAARHAGVAAAHVAGLDGGRAARARQRRRLAQRAPAAVALVLPALFVMLSLLNIRAARVVATVAVAVVAWLRMAGRSGKAQPSAQGGAYRTPLSVSSPSTVFVRRCSAGRSHALRVRRVGLPPLVRLLVRGGGAQPRRVLRLAPPQRRPHRGVMCH